MVDKSARGLSKGADTRPQLKQTNKHCNMLDWPYSNDPEAVEAHVRGNE